MAGTPVIIADSSYVVRLGLSTILKKEGGFRILSEAANAEELSEQVPKSGNAVVLLDYTSSGFSIDIIPKLLQQNELLKVVAITPEQSGVTLINAIRSGVMSYVKKDCDRDEIVDAVKMTAEGEKFFCGKILETIRKEAIAVENLTAEDYTCDPIVLSERELDVIRLIAEGYTNTQIAEKLFLSAHTIATHRKNIMQKLGLNNTAAIVMYAVKTHLVSPNKFLFAQ